MKTKQIKNLAEFCRDADMLVYDSQYTNDEYNWLNGAFSPEGWGHSNVLERVKVSDAANVENFMLFYNDPTEDDEFIQKI